VASARWLMSEFKFRSGCCHLIGGKERGDRRNRGGKLEGVGKSEQMKLVSARVASLMRGYWPERGERTGGGSSS
jgi:hypothetical protein